MANTNIMCYSLGRSNNSTGTGSPNVPDMHLIQTNVATSTAASFTANLTPYFPTTIRALNQNALPDTPNQTIWYYYTFPGLNPIQQPSLPKFTNYPITP